MSTKDFRGGLEIFGHPVWLQKIPELEELKLTEQVTPWLLC